MVLQVLAALTDCGDETTSQAVRAELAAALDVPLSDWLAKFGKRKPAKD